MSRSLILALAVLLIVCAAACDSRTLIDLGGEPIVDPPQDFSIAGTYATTTIEVLDTCGFDAPPTDGPLRIEETGETLIFTFVDELGMCEPSVRTRTGNFVTLNRADTLDACNGTVLVQSTIVYEFTEHGFTGTANLIYSNGTGQCSNLPCEYRLSIAGVRCQDCWSGCNSASSAVPSPAAR